ncbi:PepSY domain-containing protein [Steroidobacter sp. S1-65]|uniref:PepSY domain-containing protein n=1 Tax=Steroidobacter gossypii TaxID=2805490 RepID=A0ABS1X4H1_9GAMM|nr:PepSY domain-containing protein [Steroidobacter gossypii]MBM0108112.1 PepSY domain-containing protein [Steroidobacter gossypii]
MNIQTRSTGLRTGLIAAVASLAAVAGVGYAQTQQAAQEKLVEVPANALSAGDIESRLTAQGIKVKEIEIHDLIAEVDGYDAQGREIDVVVDRRNGEMLAHRFDD